MVSAIIIMNLSIGFTVAESRVYSFHVGFFRD